MALMSSSVQDTERISSSLSSKSNWLTEWFCGDFLFLAFFVLCDFFLWEHFKANFSFWQVEQVFPKAGHFDLSSSCVWPQNQQSFIRDDLFAPLDGFLTRGWGCVWFCADIASSWVDVFSALRHISIHFSTVRSGTWSSFFLKLQSRTPQTILSLIISSLGAPKLHVSERHLKFDA